MSKITGRDLTMLQAEVMEKIGEADSVVKEAIGLVESYVLTLHTSGLSVRAISASMQDTRFNQRVFGVDKISPKRASALVGLGGLVKDGRVKFDTYLLSDVKTVTAQFDSKDAREKFDALVESKDTWALSALAAAIRDEKTPAEKKPETLEQAIARLVKQVTSVSEKHDRTFAQVVKAVEAGLAVQVVSAQGKATKAA